MSNEFYTKGVVVRLRCSSWSGKKKERITNFGVGFDIGTTDLVDDPSIKLIDGVWRNKITSWQQAFRNIPLKYGYKMPSKGTYYILNERLSEFKQAWDEKFASYSTDVLAPLKEAFAVMMEGRLEEIKSQSQAIYDHNVNIYERNIIDEADLLPVTFVDNRVDRMRAEFQRVASNIDTIYSVGWTADESMSLVCLTDEAKLLLDTLDTGNAELRQAIISMSKQNVNSVVKGVKFIYQDAIVERLTPFFKTINPEQEEPAKVHGKTINGIRNFLTAHIGKKPDMSMQPIADKMLELNAMLPDGKNVPYTEMNARREVVYNKIAALFNLIQTSAAYIEEKHEQVETAKQRNLEIDW